MANHGVPQLLGEIAADVLQSIQLPEGPKPPPRICPNGHEIEAQPFGMPAVRIDGQERPSTRRWEYPRECPTCYEDRQRKARVEALFRASGLSEDDRRFTFANWDDVFNPASDSEPGAQVANQYCRRLCATFALHQAKGRGLLLIGPTGTGKTHLIKACGLYLLAKEHRVVYARVPDLMDKAARRYGPTPREIYEDMLRGVEVLLLDEISVESVERKHFQTLMETISGLVVLATTNYSPQGLDEALGPASVSRLKRLCLPVMVTGRDYREHEGEMLAAEEVG